VVVKRNFVSVLLCLLLVGTNVWAIPPTPPYSLPSQAGNSGKILSTDGTNESWAIASAVGTDNNTVQGSRLGGTGQDSSAWTGVPYIDGGTWADSNQTKARRLMGLGSLATLSAETDTLATVTGRGASTSTKVTLSGNVAISGALGTIDNATIGSTTPAAITGTTVNWAKGADIASAGTVNLCTATGDVLDVTGATGPITAFGTCNAGITRWVRFTGAPTITYNGTSMILPGSRSIDVAAGDRAVFVSLGSGNWYCQAYMKADGSVLGDVTIVTHSATEAVTAISLHGQWHNITGAYTVTLPAAVLGMSGKFYATTAAVFSVDSNAADHFDYRGTALSAGYKLTSDGFAGTFVEITCDRANTWTVTNTSGLLVDGGA
jgi:hypothetical protein